VEHNAQFLCLSRSQELTHCSGEGLLQSLEIARGQPLGNDSRETARTKIQDGG
jgi:hypothetical protein